MELSPDRFGFYQVGTYKTFNKLDAIARHTATGIHPRWDFNDQAFNKVNWQVEPASTLPELYAMRAAQLRARYDYLVLFFSGGADSTNVLNIFVQNNIPLDEICTWSLSKINGGQAIGTDAEIYKAAIPYAEQAVKLSPKTKFRLFDVSEYVLDQSLDFESYIFNQASIFTHRCAVWQQVHTVVPEYKKMLNSSKKIGFIWAGDKPRVFQYNNRYAIQFLDIIDNMVRPGTTDPIEFFYWSSELPELIVKQGHIIKRYLEHCTAHSQFITSESTGLAYTVRDNKKLWLTTHGVHTLIYPGWDINTFSIGKTKSPMIDTSISDKYYDTSLNPDVERRLRILRSRWEQTPEYWRNSPDRLLSGFKSLMSKEYFLN